MSTSEFEFPKTQRLIFHTADPRVSLVHVTKGCHSYSPFDITKHKAMPTSCSCVIGIGLIFEPVRSEYFRKYELKFAPKCNNASERFNHCLQNLPTPAHVCSKALPFFQFFVMLVYCSFPLPLDQIIAYCY